VSDERIAAFTVVSFSTDLKEERSCWYILLFYDALMTREEL
jgi:hypothetical protein